MKKYYLYFKKEKLKKGVALLFAIVISMILFTILTGVLSISLKETIFSISIKNSNDAFYAADGAVECALLNDKVGETVFAYNSSGNISCFNSSFPVIKAGSDINQSFDFVVSFPENNACAKVNLKKEYDLKVDPMGDPVLINTMILSRGYNRGGAACDQSGLKSAERVLEVTY